MRCASEGYYSYKIRTKVHLAIEKVTLITTGQEARGGKLLRNKLL